MIRHLLAVDDRGVATNLVVGLDLLSFYFLEKFNSDELQAFVNLVLNIHNGCGNGLRYSIWDDYMDKSHIKKDNYLQPILNILKNVQQKLREDEIKRLLNHKTNENDDPAILRHLKKILQIEKGNLMDTYKEFAKYLTNETDQNKFLQLVSLYPSF